MQVGKVGWQILGSLDVFEKNFLKTILLTKILAYYIINRYLLQDRKHRHVQSECYYSHL